MKKIIFAVRLGICLGILLICQGQLGPVAYAAAAKATEVTVVPADAEVSADAEGPAAAEAARLAGGMKARIEILREESGEESSLWEKIKGILLDIWENAGKEEAEEESEEDRIFIDQQLKTRIFLVVMVVAVALLFLFLVISFLRSSWKEKLHSIVVLILAIAIVVGLVLLGLQL